MLYTCKLDAFDTLDLEEMLKHQTFHPQAEEVPVEMDKISVLTTASVLIAANVFGDRRLETGERVERAARGRVLRKA